MAVRLRRVVVSPRLRNPLPLTVIRVGGSFVKGRWTPAEPVNISTKGIEAGVSDEEVLQVPEGDRIKGLKKFFVPITLVGASVGASDKTPDKIIDSNGETWKVQLVDNRVVNGFTSAVCVRIKGA